MLAADPADRFQSMAALVAALDETRVPGEEAGAAEGGAGGVPALVAGPMARLAVYAILGVAVLAGLGWAGLRLWPAKGRAPASAVHAPVPAVSPAERVRRAVEAAIPGVPCFMARHRCRRLCGRRRADQGVGRGRRPDPRQQRRDRGGQRGRRRRRPGRHQRRRPGPARRLPGAGRPAPAPRSRPPTAPAGSRSCSPPSRCPPGSRDARTAAGPGRWRT